MGGHSLLATQVMSRLRTTFNLEPSLLQFFEAPTVADFAVIMTQQLAAAVDEADLAEALAAIEVLSADEVEAVLAEAGTIAQEVSCE
ncbi:MAG: hypothetical protein F6K19_49730 [Cyanothece sp. SIO1E1]|nr:hypothetical protein [Cyanothece sp. SIO1E1]